MNLRDRIDVLANAARLKSAELRAEAEVHRAARASGAEEAKAARLEAASIARAEARAKNSARKLLGMSEVPYRPKREHEYPSYVEQMEQNRAIKVARLDAEAEAWDKLAEVASRGHLPSFGELESYGHRVRSEVDRIAPGLWSDAFKSGHTAGLPVEEPDPASTYYFSED